MTIQEACKQIPVDLFEAMMNGVPVQNDPKYLISSDAKPRYASINAITLRREKGGRIRIQLELQDRSTSSVVIADPNTVSPIL